MGEILARLNDGEEDEGKRMAGVIRRKFGINARTMRDGGSSNGKLIVVTDDPTIKKEMKVGVGKFCEGWIERHRDER